MIFVSPPFFDKVFTVAHRYPSVKHFIVYDSVNGDASTKQSNVHSFNEILKLQNATNAANFTCQPQNMEKNVVLILCSSGTTGLPKGVQLTQFNFILANYQYQ